MQLITRTKTSISSEARLNYNTNIPMENRKLNKERAKRKTNNFE